MKGVFGAKWSSKQRSNPCKLCALISGVSSSLFFPISLNFPRVQIVPFLPYRSTRTDFDLTSSALNPCLQLPTDSPSTPIYNSNTTQPLTQWSPHRHTTVCKWIVLPPSMRWLHLSTHGSPFTPLPKSSSSKPSPKFRWILSSTSIIPPHSSETSSKAMPLLSAITLLSLDFPTDRRIWK